MKIMKLARYEPENPRYHFKNKAFLSIGHYNIHKV